MAKTLKLCPEYCIDLFNENLSHLSKIFVSQEDKTVVNSTSVKMYEASTSKEQEDQDKNIVNTTEKSGMDGVNNMSKTFKSLITAVTFCVLCRTLLGIIYLINRT